ncbi:MAG: hypothetical protein JXR73_19960 [Candidatus Omnitrophica bacterium]|nr:hypothetical protein [Candidatus Omnitrophota bacterium]
MNTNENTIREQQQIATDQASATITTQTTSLSTRQKKLVTDSATVRGNIQAIVAVVVMVVALFGTDVKIHEQQQVVDAITQITGSLAALWAILQNLRSIFGRIAAREDLVFSKDDVVK